MKKKSAISMGPGAASLILIFVLLTISVLGMLSLMNSRNDKSLSARSAEVAEAVYALNAAAEETRAELSESLIGLPETDINPGEGRFLLADGCISWTEEDGSRILECAVRPVTDTDGIVRKLEWTRHSMTSNIGNAGEEWN